MLNHSAKACKNLRSAKHFSDLHFSDLQNAKICRFFRFLHRYLTPPPPGGRAHSAGRPPMMRPIVPRRKRNIAPFAYTYVKCRPGSVDGPPFFAVESLNFCSRSLLISLFAISPFSATSEDPPKRLTFSRLPLFRPTSNSTSALIYKTHTGS